MLSDGARVLLLELPIHGARVSRNLACYAPDGSHRWTATPGQHGPDEFVAARLDADTLVANTWSGYALWLDIASGKELRRIFTK